MELYNKFIEYLREHKFEIEEDIFDSYGYTTVYLSAWNKYIRIQGESYDGGNFWRIGIDPKWCFNKLSQCSIIAWFPMKRREEKRFWKCLDRITNPKDKFFKRWNKEGSTSWCGEFAEFGSY